MRGKKDENGFMSAGQMNHRFINVLQLVYLSARKDGYGNYIVDQDIMEKVETELDFNTNEETKSKIIEESKKKYRKRKSYLLWNQILSEGNYQSQKKAKEVLMAVHDSNKHFHNSMTHQRYAMETMQLALDDHFGTNKLKITPSRFLTRNTKKTNKKKGAKCKTKSIQKIAMIQSSSSSALPF